MPDFVDEIRERSAATGSFHRLIRSLRYAPFPASIDDAKFNRQRNKNLSTVWALVLLDGKRKIDYNPLHKICRFARVVRQENYMAALEAEHVRRRLSPT